MSGGAGEADAGARGCLPALSEAVNTSWAAKAARGRGGGGRALPGLEGLREEAVPVLRVWESPVLGSKTCPRNLRRGQTPRLGAW